jgi:hypothetical protein
MSTPANSLGSPTSPMPPPPNTAIARDGMGDKEGSFPQPMTGGPIVGPNHGPGGDRRNGSFPGGESRGVVVPPNRMFPLGRS